MTINFICGVIAELFDSPCNFSPIDEYMFQDNFCESHCGEVADKDCWKRYFEKRWEDSKMSEIPSDSEKPNNSTCSILEQVDKDTNVRSKYDCKTCKHDLWHTPRMCGKCVRQEDGKPSMYEPKTEPQTDEEYINNLPWTEAGNGEQTDIEIARAIVHKAIDDTPIAEDAYPDLRQKMHDAVDNYEPQTDYTITGTIGYRCPKCGRGNFLSNESNCVYCGEPLIKTDCAWKKGE